MVHPEVHRTLLLSLFFSYGDLFIMAMSLDELRQSLPASGRTSARVAAADMQSPGRQVREEDKEQSSEEVAQFDRLLEIGDTVQIGWARRRQEVARTVHTWIGIVREVSPEVKIDYGSENGILVFPHPDIAYAELIRIPRRYLADQGVESRHNRNRNNTSDNHDAILRILVEEQRKSSQSLAAVAAALANFPRQGAAAAAVAGGVTEMKKVCADDEDRSEIILTLRLWGEQVVQTHTQPRVVEDTATGIKLRVSAWERSLTLSSLVFNHFRVGKSTKDRRIREAAETLLEAIFAGLEVNEGFAWLESLLIQSFRAVRRLAAERDGVNVAKVEQEFGTRTSRSKWDVFAAKHTTTNNSNNNKEESTGARRGGGRGRGKAKDTKELVCRRCQEKGHFASSCKAPAPVSPNGRE